ncbi:HNH endonuclease [Acidithiobacillus thiooxidans]|uniref:HNH endonuclease 5 domain-containing protein n=1 Tax=Acidithiobacillus thiooxidans TaxID=930 RepID=A0A1C2IBY2_ACITH|nr:HNH endonuclease [Acidithiobacillus thiooxidans]OCX73463.1 hypothetical protein A6M23_07920 [Acidithiobacillus thiooxidans]OCX85996.1 hypothetical protein A6P08_07060 [Acidithiobacillus thiooxidans]
MKKQMCYLCDKPFDGVIVKKHDEHVIQNAIGGKLIGSDILCQSCGGRLGTQVDSYFAQAISGIAVLFDVPRDRGKAPITNAQVVVKDKENSLLESDIFLLNSDFSVTPVKPIYLKHEVAKTVTVFAPKAKTAKQYMQSKDLINLKSQDYEIIICTNVAEYIQKIILKVDTTSTALLRGMLKISIGFASLHGVKRADINHLFIGVDDLINDESTLRTIVFPYYPTTDEEMLYETEKSLHEDWFPNHQIYLFSNGCDLFCYVELFGTIQKYVHLSYRYSGPAIKEKYLQKSDTWDFNETGFLARTFSDLDLLARQLDVETKDMQWQDIQKKIFHQARIRAYSLDADSQVEKVRKLMGSVAMFSMINNLDRIEVAHQLLSRANKAKILLGMKWLEELKTDPMAAMRIIRDDFTSFRIGTPTHFCPDEVRKVSADNVKKYVTYKFYDLLCSCGKEDSLHYELA